jgi:hypothetical protein
LTQLHHLGEAAQAMVTDPLVGSASGYSLVAFSPGLERADAELLEQQPLVTDFLHLLPAAEKRSFFAFHPLPSGAWALTRRFLHGQRRGAFNRVVVHALVLPPALLERLDDPLLALRAHAFLGEGREPWIRLGDRLIEEGSFGGAALALPRLAVLAPADLEEQRIAAVLAQRDHLLAGWGEARLRQSLERAFAALAAGRLLLDQGPEEEQLLTLLFSLLPSRDRRRLAFATHLSSESLGLFRLAAIEASRQVIERLPAGHGTFGLFSELPPARNGGAAALAGLVFDKNLLELWLRTERSAGASLWDDGAGLAAQAAFLAGGEQKILGGFAGWPELRRFLDQVGQALHSGGRAAWQDPAVILTAVAATLLRRLAEEDAETSLRTAIDCLDLPRLVDKVLAPASLQAFYQRDPGRLGAAGRVAAIGLELAAGRPAPAELEAAWTAFPREAPQGPLRRLWEPVYGRLAEALVARRVGAGAEALAAWAAVRGLERLAGEKQDAWRALLLFDLAGREGRPDLQRGLAERLLGPALAAGDEEVPAGAAASIAAALQGNRRFPPLAAALWQRLASPRYEIEPYAGWLAGLELVRPGEEGVAELAQAWLPRLESLPATAAGERLLANLARLADQRQAKLLAAAGERRQLLLGRTTPLAVLERLLEAGAFADPERFAGDLLGQLGRDPERRLAEGLDLLRSPALSPRVKWLLEEPFLGRLLDGAGEAILKSRLGFAEIEESFGLHAQQLLARALGRESRRLSPPPTEFLSGALRAGRMDLAGVFLRAAGGGFVRALGKKQRGLAAQLRTAFSRPAHRLDLQPFGDLISRLEEAS